MPATFAGAIAGGSTSSNITVTPNEVFSVQSDQPVSVQSRNAQSSGWATIGSLTSADAKSYIAPSDTVRIVRGAGTAANVEVWA